MAELQAGKAAVSGNGAILDVRSEDDVWVVEFMSEARTAPERLWFHVQCTGADSRPVRFLWRNAGLCLGLGDVASLANVRPVVRTDGGEWQRVEETLLVQSPTGHVALQFATPGECSQCAAAFCFPYGHAELRHAVTEAAGAWHVETLDVSAGGRPLVRLLAPSAEGNEAGVYIVARQHAGETPGSWVLDGILRAVTAGHAEGRLHEADWWAVPFANVDGVVEGDYGKDPMPADFNRAWAPMPLRPEVYAIQRDMRQFAGRYGRRLVMDLHAPGGGETGLYQFLPREGRPDEQRAAAESFSSLLAAQFADLPGESISRVPDYASRWDSNHTATCWAWDHLDGTLGVSIEISYQALTEDDRLLPEGYRAIGRRLAAVAVTWLKGELRRSP
jgi:hypothetical protein